MRKYQGLFLRQINVIQLLDVWFFSHGDEGAGGICPGQVTHPEAFTAAR